MGSFRRAWPAALALALLLALGPACQTTSPANTYASATPGATPAARQNTSSHHFLFFPWFSGGRTGGSNSRPSGGQTTSPRTPAQAPNSGGSSPSFSGGSGSRFGGGKIPSFSGGSGSKFGGGKAPSFRGGGGSHFGGRGHK